MNRIVLLLLVAPLMGVAQDRSERIARSNTTPAPSPQQRIQDMPVLLDEELPALELASFEASSTANEGVSVQFATVSERPEETFIVQRSGDLIHWEAVATVMGSGNADDYTSYQVHDEAPISGVSYYRLVHDEAGELRELSDLFSVRHETYQDLSFQNGSVPGQFHVLASGSLAEVVVLNNRGQFMPLEMATDGDRVTVSAPLLENGTYYVQAVVDGTPVMRSITITNGTVIGG